jgi:thiamine biosynthesis lipoprotein
MTFLSAVLAIPLLLSCKQEISSRQEYVLGTICTINLFEQGTDPLYDELFARLRELEGILSANRDDTNLSAINAKAGITPQQGSQETIEVLTKAMEIARATDGAFNPAIGPLVKLWGIGTEFAHVPTAKEIEEARSLSAWRDVEINAQENRVYLPKPGMRLDLGGIAKGYAADEIVSILKSRGITRAIIDLGGNVLAYGEKAKGTPWTVGIRNPETNRGDPVLVMKIANQSVVTSGIYERFFEDQGKHYHHILDTETGMPAETGLLSVTIISDSSITADALSTSAFVLGLQRGMAFVNTVSGTEAVFITRDNRIYATKGIVSQLELRDTTYTLMGD